jgi:hypothetical protein
VIIKKAIFLLLILALIISSAGCAGKNDKGTSTQKASDTQELKSDEAQDVNTTLTGEGNSYAEWKYIDPSLVAVQGEGDEKTLTEIR